MIVATASSHRRSNFSMSALVGASSLSGGSVVVSPFCAELADGRRLTTSTPIRARCRPDRK
jgi:hypothetical protein